MKDRRCVAIIVAKTDIKKKALLCADRSQMEWVTQLVNARQHQDGNGANTEEKELEDDLLTRIKAKNQKAFALDAAAKSLPELCKVPLPLPEPQET
jgi:hypothetical protein